MPESVQSSRHQELVGFIWSIADKLRGPYRPPQYRRVMLPLIVLRRLDAVLEPTKAEVLKAKAKYEELRLTGDALEKALAKVVIGAERKQSLYNLSQYTLRGLLDDPDGLAPNLQGYINSFSVRARDIFDKFEFSKEIEKLDENNRLFLILKEICRPDIDLSPGS
ncbi:MAG: type I restriction-modification system subunit M N-terminal domain-containing protein, partial [Cyanobacteriota bacterium]|nr:type I restriction-modification system subunit M N-terminal domain-containing protein [Cyanobacteriota bacterium]